jgi:hypothetical protein
MAALELRRLFLSIVQSPQSGASMAPMRGRSALDTRIFPPRREWRERPCGYVLALDNPPLTNVSLGLRPSTLAQPSHGCWLRHAAFGSAPHLGTGG